MPTVNSSTAIVTTPSIPFRNEEFIDFSVSENKRAMRDALIDVQSELGREYDLVIGGRRLQLSGKLCRSILLCRRR